jgi:uncharacterized membrane protein YgcG
MRRSPAQGRKPDLAALATVGGIALVAVAAVLTALSAFRAPQLSDLPKEAFEINERQVDEEASFNPLDFVFGVGDALQGQTFDVAGTVNDPSVYQDLSRESAREFNAALPFSGDRGPPATAFFARAGGPLDAARAQHCMSLAVYYEAASESLTGQQAVAQVVLNRVRHPAWPNSVCGVVFQGSERRTGCQFSFTCDGSLARQPSARAWRVAQAVASSALNGHVVPEVGHATHYHTDWVAPRWAPSLRKLVQIGAHIFYTWKGRGGEPAAFRTRYAAKEAWPGKAAATAPGLGPAEGPAPETPTQPLDLMTLMAGLLPGGGADGAGAAPPGAAGAVGAGLPAGAQAARQGAGVSGGSLGGAGGAGSLAQASGGGSTGGGAASAPWQPPRPGPNGLMPEPELGSILPTYAPIVEPAPRPEAAPAPAPANPAAQSPSERRGRSMQGL